MTGRIEFSRDEVEAILKANVCGMLPGDARIGHVSLDYGHAQIDFTDEPELPVVAVPAPVELRDDPEQF